MQFGYIGYSVYTAEISNLNLSNVDVTGYNFTGSLVGEVRPHPQPFLVDRIGHQVFERLLPSWNQRIFEIITLVKLNQGLTSPAKQRKVVVVVGITAIFG